MTTLTGNKDVDLTILEYLEDKDLFLFCETGKLDKYVRKLCGDEYFWMNRVRKTFGKLKKVENRTWKNFYLSLIYYIDKYGDRKMEDTAFVRELSEKNDTDLFTYFISIGKFLDWRSALLGAILGENIEIIQYFTPEGNDDQAYWRIAVDAAIRTGNLKNVIFLLPKLIDLEKLGPAYYFLLPAAEKGKIDFLKYMFTILKIKDTDILKLIQLFSLPKGQLKISYPEIESTFLFLVHYYFELGGNKTNLSKVIRNILREDIKDRNFSKLLKMYK